MKKGDPGPLLGKVDKSKRDFVRKLALGTAYAVPAISTFSLDSMRNKAFAAGVYIAPAVLGLGIVPGSSLALIDGYVDLEGDLCAEDFMFVITYNRPMAKTYNSAKKYIYQTGFSDFSPVPCGTEPTGADIPAPPAGCPGGTGLTWQWNADGTKEFAVIPCCGNARLFLWLNHASCSQNTWYRDPAGELMTPFFDIADLCAP